MGIDTATTEATRRTIEHFYKVGFSGDLPGMLALMDENVVVHEPPFLPYGGVTCGHAEFLRLFERLNQYWDPFTMRIERLVVEGDRAIAILHCTARNGKEILLAEEITVRNGKAVELRVYFHHAGGIPLNN